MACAPTARPTPPSIAPAACAAIEARCDRGIADDAAFATARRRCWACHATGGLAGHDFADVGALRAAAIGEPLATCQMPPAGAVLPDDERALLVAWAVCQANK